MTLILKKLGIAIEILKVHKIKDAENNKSYIYYYSAKRLDGGYIKRYIRYNEPLAWQHRNEQARIDKELELREKIKENHEPVETVEEDYLDYFFRMLEEL